MRFRRFLYIFIPLILFTIVFVLDILRKNVALDLFGLWYLRDLSVLAAFFFSYLFIKGLPAFTSVRNPVKRLGSTFILAIIVIAEYSLLSFIRREGFLPVEGVLAPQDYLTVIIATILSIGTGWMVIAVFLHLKSMVLLRRKKGTRRNLVILILLLLATGLSAFGSHPLEMPLATSILLGFSLLMIVVISFRLSWIVLLSRKEKVYSIIYGILMFAAFLSIDLLLNGTFLEKALLYYSPPLKYFSFLVAMFATLYSGLAFVSTLFHLPTADAYERKQSEVNSLHNLGRLITRVFDFDDLVSTVTRMTREVCGAQSAWLEIVEPVPGTDGSGRVVTVSMRDITGEQVAILNGPGGDLLRKIVSEKQHVVLIDDIGADRRFAHIGKLKKNIGSLLIVPLLSHDTMIGILYATKGRQDSFDQDDIEVISTFADNVTIAIENSRLIGKSLERERLQRDMMLAREMQQKLLPQNIPSDPRFELSATSIPASEVGGDYYDVADLDTGVIGIVVGDVSGKGISAAFYMAEVKGIFQSLSKMTQSPKQFLVLANNALSGSLEKKSFVSLVYVILDVINGKLRIARAGHCPMLFLGKEGGKFVQPLGLGLGLSRDAVFEESTDEEEMILNSGDICVFYTDGVTEARDTAGEEFGTERLLKVVTGRRCESAEKIRDGILEAIHGYCESGPDDDLTVLVLKWLGTDSAAGAREEQ